MKLEDYFDFLEVDDIRLQGTRVGIETILLDYTDLKISPEQITARYPSLTLEQVYATITYYLHNRSQVEAYLQSWKAHNEEMRRKHAIDLAEIHARLSPTLHQTRPPFAAEPGTQVFA